MKKLTMEFTETNQEVKKIRGKNTTTFNIIIKDEKGNTITQAKDITCRTDRKTSEGFPTIRTQTRNTFKQANGNFENGQVNIFRTHRIDGNYYYEISLEIAGHEGLYTFDSNQGRAVDWAKDLATAFELGYNFPANASQIIDREEAGEKYQIPLAYRGKERMIISESIKQEKQEEAKQRKEAEKQEKEAKQARQKEEKREEVKTLIKEENLEELTYKALQGLAKEAGIRANQKKETIINELKKLA